MRTELGKIRSAEFGSGGYQDAQFGISFDLAGAGWGVGDFGGAWATEHTKHCKWTHAERLAELGNMAWRLNQVMDDAKVGSVSKLRGIPIEATFDGNLLKSWRVLTEVL